MNRPTFASSAITRMVPKEEWQHVPPYFNWPVPTFITQCPDCPHDNVWRTTGALPGIICCEKCNKSLIASP